MLVFEDRNTSHIRTHAMNECAGRMGSAPGGKCSHPPRFRVTNGTLIRLSCGWHLARFADQLAIIGGPPLHVTKLP